jgi:hypothetical protein
MAYIDPGAGTLILQAVIAAVVGGVAFFRRTIGGWFGLGRRKTPPDAAGK